MKLTPVASFVLGSAILGVTSLVSAQANAPATGPASAPASAPVSLQATISAVEGNVQVRLDEAAAWQPAKAGMLLGEGSEFRTGPRSAVQFEIPPGQVITLDRLGQC